MAKEYLKMANVFELPVNDDDRESAVDLFSHMVATPYSVDYTITLSKYAAHAINSHDELVAENERLRGALHDAATSLETIHIRSFGEESMLDSKQEMRAYAGARAMVARKDLSGE